LQCLANTIKLPPRILKYDMYRGLDNCGNYVFLPKILWQEAAGIGLHK
jgi:hypothetical protein